jgi:hypothetical protein
MFLGFRVYECELPQHLLNPGGQGVTFGVTRVRKTGIVASRRPGRMLRVVYSMILKIDLYLGALSRSTKLSASCRLRMQPWTIRASDDFLLWG